MYINAGFCGYLGFQINGQSGLTYLDDIFVAGGLIGFRVADSSVFGNNLTFEQNTPSVWGYSVQGDTGSSYFNCNGCGLDAENEGTVWLGTLQLDNMETAVWNGGALTGGSNGVTDVPAVEIDGGSERGSFTSVGTNFTAVGGPEFIDVVNNGFGTLISPFGIRGTGVPISNVTSNVLLENPAAPSSFGGTNGTFTAIPLSEGADNNILITTTGYTQTSNIGCTGSTTPSACCTGVNTGTCGNPQTVCFGSASTCTATVNGTTAVLPCTVNLGLQTLVNLPTFSFSCDQMTYQPTANQSCVVLPSNILMTGLGTAENCNIKVEGQ
jgi:hypothetical protein